MSRWSGHNLRVCTFSISLLCCKSTHHFVYANDENAQRFGHKFCARFGSCDTFIERWEFRRNQICSFFLFTDAQIFWFRLLVSPSRKWERQLSQPLANGKWSIQWPGWPIANFQHQFTCKCGANAFNQFIVLWIRWNGLQLVAPCELNETADHDAALSNARI